MNPASVYCVIINVMICFLHLHSIDDVTQSQGLGGWLRGSVNNATLHTSRLVHGLYGACTILLYETQAMNDISCHSYATMHTK